MFLDDHLYAHTKSKEIQNAEDYKDLVNELYRICEDHWKTGLAIERDKTVIKAALDRTFKSWDIFINRLRNENWFLISILDRYDVSYKGAFLSNPEFERIYGSL